MNSSGRIKVEFPEKLKCLFVPQRYKIFYGGRGGAKSWGIARALLLLGTQRPLRILCARELQKAIKDSVHQLLSDQIKSLGLHKQYEILATEIKGTNGTRFFFEGLRHNVSNIKSYEGADICWVEEAHAVSKGSWDVLIPTIRKEGSEIWISFNPELEDDETYKRFVLHPPKDSFSIKVGFEDNPWFPDVLRREMEELKTRDFDSYLHVWCGHCRQMLDGAIYADELRAAKEQGRITSVPVDQAKPVDVFFDLGWADCTSIWFVQTVGKEIRTVDFYQNQLQKLQHYIQVMQNKGYVYGHIHLPHDATHGQLSGKNVEQTVRGLGFKVKIVDKLRIEQGIQAARTLFPSLWFDEGRCSDGLTALRKYRYDVDPNTGAFSKSPLHDENSHAADAFRYLAVGYSPPRQKHTTPRPASSGWMGM